MLRGFIALGVILGFCLAPARAEASSRPNSTNTPLLGEVHFILHDLVVQPPGGHPGLGRIQEPIFNRYRAATNSNGLATIGFQDGTVLHFNHNTDAIFRSPTLTYIKKGVIDQILSPGGNHRVQTAAAVASAVGTDFGLEISGNVSLFYVREGSLLVQNPQGYVYVQNGQATTVIKGQAPTPPFSYDVVKALRWVSELAPVLPPLDTDLALAANGGHIVGVSSQDSALGPAAAAKVGRFDGGWSSAPGQVRSQQLKVGFATTKLHLISAAVISTQSFGQQPIGTMLQHFEILGSMTGTNDSDFQLIFSGVAKQKMGLQRFEFPTPADARYVELLALDNFGDLQHLDVTEFEAVGHPDLDGSGSIIRPCTLVTLCVNNMLDLVNSARRQAKLPPLKLNDTLSFGQGSCTGALGHSIDMARTHAVWHVSSLYPQASYPQDVCMMANHMSENIGMAATGIELKDIKTIFTLQIGEAHDAATCHRVVNHACNIVDPRFKWIGIGLYFDGTDTWLTTIFVA